MLEDSEACTYFVHVFEDQNGLKRIKQDQFGLKSLGFSERSFVLLGSICLHTAGVGGSNPLPPTR